jgi:hypothetical protein
MAPLALAGVVWLCPHGGFDAKRWGLLCLFAATICGLIARPLPNGALVLVSITTGTLLGLFSLGEALSGFSNVTVWLIVAAFLFARGLVQTRLGERIAYAIVARLGASPLRLGYAIVLADLAMAPMTPSNTARAGGILFPITLNVARACGSEPGPTAGRMGAFLMTTLYQGDLVVSADSSASCWFRTRSTACARPKRRRPVSRNRWPPNGWTRWVRRRGPSASPSVFSRWCCCYGCLENGTAFQRRPSRAWDWPCCWSPECCNGRISSTRKRRGTRSSGSAAS